MDALRLRLEEKEATLNKKSKQIQEISEEKGTLNGEIHDLKDMLEVKERKINVLQKKVYRLFFCHSVDFDFKHARLCCGLSVNFAHCVHLCRLRTCRNS